MLPLTPPSGDPTRSLRSSVLIGTQDLLASALRGSDEAWREIYARYQSYLAVMVRVRIPSLVQARFDHEDVLQSAFVSVYERIDSFEYQGEGSFRRWLASVVVNELRDVLKHHACSKRSAAQEDAPLETGLLNALSGPPEQDPSAIAQREEQNALILRGMTLLDEEDQELLCMRIFEQKTWAHIGEILEINETQARRRWSETARRLIGTFAQGA